MKALLRLLLIFRERAIDKKYSASSSLKIDWAINRIERRTHDNN
jgi:hypothetical protein